MGLVLPDAGMISLLEETISHETVLRLRRKMGYENVILGTALLAQRMFDLVERIELPKGRRL
jgi:ABC-type proline/glycine betaine transport system ATPase subunit